MSASTVRRYDLEMSMRGDWQDMKPRENGDWIHFEDAEKCLNAHDALVAALKYAARQLRTIGTPDDAVNNTVLVICDDALAQAGAA